MKKNLVLLILILFIVGCSKEEKNIKDDTTTKQIEEVENIYVDDNNTEIGLYFQKGNKLELISEYKTSLISSKDIGIFQIYPSNREEVILNNDFGTEFFNIWQSIPDHDSLKIGFNVKYYLIGGEEVSYNIMDYSVIYKELFNYLYDDYANRYNSWYSHIEESTYTKDTLFTSIKLYGAQVEEIESKIFFTVFTYDSLDDFDTNGNYRGNSSYTITICDINKTC